MSELSQEIEAYEAIRGDVEAKHLGKWIVVHDRQLIGVYDSFDSAAEDAVKKFGRGPYLIRQVGAPPMTLPASVMYHPVHADNKVRV